MLEAGMNELLLMYDTYYDITTSITNSGPVYIYTHDIWFHIGLVMEGAPSHYCSNRSMYRMLPILMT